MKKTLIILFALSAFTVKAQEYPEVTIGGSQIRTITSTIVEGQEYELHISLPGDYENSTKKYPVVYVMDSQWDFPSVTSIYGQQYYDGFVPGVIIVGIASNDANSTFRARDYTPTALGNRDTGGADNFLDFMKTELFPFIESNYRASEERTITGCSLAGLITLYALFTHTDMFDGYVAASPAVGWDSGILEQYEKEFAKKQLTKPVRVYMTVGDVERGSSYFQEFAAIMKNSNYSNVSLVSKVLENTGHSGTKSETYTRGLQHVFERAQLQLSDNVLNKYIGKYESENGNEVEIKNENSELHLYFSERNNFSLLANTESHFYATFQFFNVHFKVAEGKVEGMDIVRYGGTQALKRVN